MLPDETRPTAENEAQKVVVTSEPAKDAPLTQEEFAIEMQRLTERARAAGLSPLHTMAQTYLRQGMVILEGVVASLDTDDSSKKKKA